MGHSDGWELDEASGEKRHKIKIDLIERIGVEGIQQEVDISSIRERIYTLKAMGYNISLVTLDQFQSKEMLQILKKKGIRAEYLSVDRTVDPYNMLKEAIYEQRLDIYYNDHLFRELVQLEEVQKGSHMKIDHPKSGSKDLTDALAGCIYNIMDRTAYSSMGMMGAVDIQNNDPNITIHLEEKHRLRNVEAKIKMNNKQEEMLQRIQSRML